MNPQRLRLLIIGIALFILSPALGWVLTFLGFFRTQQAILESPPGTLPELLQIPSRLYGNFIIILLAALSAAVGLFLILYVLVMHIWGPKSDQPGSAHGGQDPAPQPTRQAAPTPAQPPRPSTPRVGPARSTPFATDPYADKTPMETAWEELNKPLAKLPDDDSRFRPKA